MKTTVAAVFALILTASTARGESFSLAPYLSGSNWQDAGMLTWVSPVNGTVSVSGFARTERSTDNVWLQYVPQYLAVGLNPGNVLQTGTTHLADGTVQSTWAPCQQAYLGTTPCIPLRQVTSLSGLTVEKGDVIAALIVNYNMFVGDTATLDLAVTIDGDFQGSGSAGTLVSPWMLDDWHAGLTGSLDPSTGHSADAYAFYWGGGNLDGTATTNGVFRNGALSGGFADGMRLDLYDASGAALIASRTVFGSSSASSPFDFGALGAGNYQLLVTDLNAADDPPYSLEFNGQIGAPQSVSTVPEPCTLLLLGTGLFGLATRCRRAGRRVQR